MKIINTDEINKIMVSEYMKALPNETGGILFGYYTDDLKSVTITDLFYNIQDSVGKRNSFIRGRKGFQKYSEKMWSQGKYYLGEWHTHPYSLPKMSITDEKVMLKIKDTKEFKCPEPILIITGEVDQHIVINGFIFYSKKILVENIYFEE